MDVAAVCCCGGAAFCPSGNLPLIPRSRDGRQRTIILRSACTPPCKRKCAIKLRTVLDLLYLLVCTTCTHQSGHRCPDCFGILLLRCFDVYGSQIGSTESGNPVWTYENRCRPTWAPSYGSSIGRQRAWRTCTAVHVHESATL